jgi:hypothetical protein
LPVHDTALRADTGIAEPELPGVGTGREPPARPLQAVRSHQYVERVPERELSLKAAAKLRGLSERNVYKRRAERRIRTHPGRDRRTKHLVYLDQFDEDIAALKCRAPGCSEPAANAGEYCSHACSVRLYPVEQRSCRQCGDVFELIGHRAKDGDENFCSPKCSTEWRWANTPESFPQSQRRGQVKTCRCGRKTRYMAPSHLHVQGCEHCAGELRAEWWAGRDDARKRASDRHADWWANVVYPEVQARTVELGGALTTEDVRHKVGDVSIPTVTRYYVKDRGWLRPVEETVHGQRFKFYVNPDEVKRVRVERAKGPAWDTWLDADWRVARAREDGTLERLVEHGLSRAQADAAVRQPVEAARDRLRTHHRGPKRAPGPSPVDRQRHALVAFAREALSDTVSKRQVMLHAARLAAEHQPWLLPDDYVVDGQLRPHYDEAAIAVMKRAENACK